MRDYFEIGPTPSSEDCAQLGTENYRQVAKVEMDAYIDQLNRMFGEKIQGTQIFFSKKWFPHDFGTYGEVVINYDDEDPNSHLVYEIERELPEKWDNEAIEYIVNECSKFLSNQEMRMLEHD
jgi:hypothetical protein